MGVKGGREEDGGQKFFRNGGREGGEESRHGRGEGRKGERSPEIVEGRKGVVKTRRKRKDVNLDTRRKTGELQGKKV